MGSRVRWPFGLLDSTSAHLEWHEFQPLPPCYLQVVLGIRVVVLDLGHCDRVQWHKMHKEEKTFTICLVESRSDELSQATDPQANLSFLGIPFGETRWLCVFCPDK